MGISAQPDVPQGSSIDAKDGSRRKHEGRDFLLVMDSLERRLEDIRSTAAAIGPLGRDTAKARETPCDEALAFTEHLASEDMLADDATGPLDFRHSQLRQLQAQRFEEKLRIGRGDGLNASWSHYPSSGVRRRASCPEVFDTQFEASPPASWSGATDVKADGERSETLGQLNKAEAEVRRLSSFLESESMLGMWR
jgi:hypothetical protein